MPDDNKAMPNENHAVPVDNEYVLDVLSYWDWGGEVIIITPYGCSNAFGYA